MPGRPERVRRRADFTGSWNCFRLGSLTNEIFTSQASPGEVLPSHDVLWFAKAKWRARFSNLHRNSHFLQFCMSQTRAADWQGRDVFSKLGQEERLRDREKEGTDVEVGMWWP